MLNDALVCSDLTYYFIIESHAEILIYIDKIIHSICQLVEIEWCSIQILILSYSISVVRCLFSVTDTPLSFSATVDANQLSKNHDICIIYFEFQLHCKGKCLG